VADARRFGGPEAHAAADDRVRAARGIADQSRSSKGASRYLYQGRRVTAAERDALDGRRALAVHGELRPRHRASQLSSNADLGRLEIKQ
jgi:hypothetical protein